MHIPRSYRRRLSRLRCHLSLSPHIRIGAVYGRPYRHLVNITANLAPTLRSLRCRLHQTLLILHQRLLPLSNNLARLPIPLLTPTTLRLPLTIHWRLLRAQDFSKLFDRAFDIDAECLLRRRFRHVFSDHVYYGIVLNSYVFTGVAVFGRLVWQEFLAWVGRLVIGGEEGVRGDQLVRPVLHHWVGAALFHRE